MGEYLLEVKNLKKHIRYIEIQENFLIQKSV